MKKLRFLLLFNFLLFPCISFANPTEDPVCGNGVQEGDEECDDGNDFSSDSCNTVCKTCTPEQIVCDGMTQGCDPELRTDCSEENTQWEGAGLMDCCGEVCGYCVRPPSDEDWGQANVNVNVNDVDVTVAVNVDAGCCEDCCEEGGDCDEDEDVDTDAIVAVDATDTGDDTADSSGSVSGADYDPETTAKISGGVACSLNPYAKNSPYQAILILVLSLLSLISFRLRSL